MIPFNITVIELNMFAVMEVHIIKKLALQDERSMVVLS